MNEEPTQTSPEFMTRVKFSKEVQNIVTDGGISYIDAVIHLCETSGIEIEDSKKYISNAIKTKIEAEAMNLNFLEKSAELPFETK
jgi:hypothetical protein